MRGFSRNLNKFSDYLVKLCGPHFHFGLPCWLWVAASAFKACRSLMFLLN